MLPKRMFTWSFFLLGSVTGGLVWGASQEASVSENKAVRPPDYMKWETVSPGTTLSPDGKWLAVPMGRVDGTHELRVQAAGGTGEPIVVAEGVQPRFSDNSLWLACKVGYSEAEERKLRKDSKPMRFQLGLVDLGSGQVQVKGNVADFEFGSEGRFLAYKKYGPEPSKEKEEGSQNEEDAAVGTDLILRDLAGSSEINFGNVSEFAWQDEGSLLAMVIDAPDRSGNGVQLYDASSGHLRALDSSDNRYKGLAWREDGEDLLVLRSKESPDYERATHLVLAWKSLTAETRVFLFDPAEDNRVPLEMRVSESPSPSWSDDGERIFFGIQERHPKKTQGEPASGDQTPEPSEKGEGSAGGEAPAGEQRLDPSKVEVWHARDERIVPMQNVRKEDDRKRSFLCVWHVEENRFLRLGTDLMEEFSLLEGQLRATETDRKPYSFDNMFDSPRHDIYLVDVSSGERKKVLEGLWFFEGGSPTGRYLLYFQKNHFWTYDTETGQHHSLTGPLGDRFVDTDYDVPVREQKPPWGAAGWLKGDKAVLLYDKFDVWKIAPDGSNPSRLTSGEAEEIRHRYIHLDEESRSEGLDLSRPLYLSLYGYWTKRYGYGRVLVDGGPGSGFERLVWLDQEVSGLIRSAESEVYAYWVEDFDKPSACLVGGPELGEAREVLATNPFHSDYAWGRSELVDYTNESGRRLQGALFYPAEYRNGDRYPMIVYVYEQLSQQVHTYVAPSERRPYNPAVFTAQGYFVFWPDIVYRDRDPGSSAVDCVVSGVRAVLQEGDVDPARIGLVGHSWGGYEASFIPTQTDLFAAAIAGAPLTNFFSFFGAIHWNPGMPETQHFETGQARMEVPYWEDMEAYARNSPVVFVEQLKTPMLVFFGNKDGVVDWHQGVELYNYARRAGKQLVMLVYPGEDHGARQIENQIDYHRRILQWFGHYLKGEEAPSWITRGVSVLERERELKEAEKASPERKN